MVQNHDDVDRVRLPLGLAHHIQRQRVGAIVVVGQNLGVRRSTSRRRHCHRTQAEHDSERRDKRERPCPKLPCDLHTNSFTPKQPPRCSYNTSLVFRPFQRKSGS